MSKLLRLTFISSLLFLYSLNLAQELPSEYDKLGKEEALTFAKKCTVKAVQFIQVRNYEEAEKWFFISFKLYYLWGARS